MLRPAFLVVGKRAHNGAGSGYVDGVLYSSEDPPERLSAKVQVEWPECQRHATIGKSAFELSANGAPMTGTAFEANSNQSVTCAMTYFISAASFPQKTISSSQFVGIGCSDAPEKSTHVERVCDDC